MCNIPVPFKIFTIEIYPNGKTVLPAFITPDGMHLSISELKQCRELIDLIIDNPNYFHVVKPESKERQIPCINCQKNLVYESSIERETGLCFDCEKKQILQASLIQGRKDYYGYLTTMQDKSEKKLYKFLQTDITGDCQAINCNKKRLVGVYFCGAHLTGAYVGPFKFELTEKSDKIIMCKHIECDNEAAPGQTKCYLHINKDVDGFQILSESEINSINNACKDTDEKPIDLNLPKPKLRTITPADITKPGC